MPETFLSAQGLRKYHKNVIKALNEKANRIHVGVSAPAESYIDTWFETDESIEAQEVNLMSEDAEAETEELTFNETSTEEELVFNTEEEEKLTFNETSTEEETEELTFNETSTEEELVFTEE